MAKHKRGGGKPSRRANARRPSGASRPTPSRTSAPAKVDRRVWIALAALTVAVLAAGMLAIGSLGGTGSGATPTPIVAAP
jgi:hypothetical protein